MSVDVWVSVAVCADVGTVEIPSGERLIALWNDSTSHMLYLDSGAWDADSVWDLDYRYEPSMFAPQWMGHIDFWCGDVDSAELGRFAERLTSRFPGLSVTTQIECRDDGSKEEFVTRDGRIVLSLDDSPRTLLTTEQIIQMAIEAYADDTHPSWAGGDDVGRWMRRLAAMIDNGEVTA